MIDFVKIQVIHLNVDQWMQKLPVQYQYSKDSDNNDIWTPSKSGNDYRRITADYQGFKIRIREVKQRDGTTIKFLNLEGSLHKFYKLENHSQFTWPELQHAINKFCDTFHVLPEMCRLTNIEFAVNMFIDQRPIDLLNNNLLSYLGDHLNHYDPDENGKKIGFYKELTNYKIKIYDKGYQYGLKGQNILRFENHSKKMVDIRKTGISTLHDLKDYNKVCQLKPILKERWKNLRFIDSEVDQKVIPEEKKKIYIIGRSIPEQKKVPYKKRAQYRDEFKQIMATYGKDYSGQYEVFVSNTWDSLINSKEVINHLPNVIESNHKVEVIHQLHKPKTNSNETAPKDFITTNMVYEIKESDPSLFYKLRKGFCKNFSGLSDNVVCERIAHNVRNHYWNGKYIQVKNSNVGSLLFD